MVGVLSLATCVAGGAPPPPGVLAGVDPRTLSAGLYLSMAADGHFGGLHRSDRARDAVTTGPAKGSPPARLDARVGRNLRLGDDPAALPASLRGQAEPHLFRCAVEPELLAATFQEGRYTDGGAVSCGFAVSRDGGLTWMRGLIPRLTQISGGSYFRATDPVAAIDRDQYLYFNTLVATGVTFGAGSAVVVSRSTDGGATFAAPALVSAIPNAQHSYDKNWMAVNDFSGTPSVNRLVVTWTDLVALGASNTAYDLLASVSDDRGLTWSAPALIKPRDTLVNQATNPVFLPDGTLLVPYITALVFTSNTAGSFRIECMRSTDGGRTYPAAPTIVVPNVFLWGDPVVRNGTFLITAAMARQSGQVFLTYGGRPSPNGTPRIYVTRSSDSGATWSAPVVVSDAPDGVSVINPAIAVTPDGRQVTVAYYDKRHSPDALNHVDLYVANSFDGGVTWRPSLRLSEYTSDVRVAPLTGSGYMLGDYQAVVPPYTASQPAVAITVDTRTRDGDPYAVRYALSATPDFPSWQLARFNLADLANPARASAAADPDGDGYPNLAEYAQGTDPLLVESGSAYAVSTTPSTFSVIRPIRPEIADVVAAWEQSPDGRIWTPAANIPTFAPLPADADLLAVRSAGATFFRHTYRRSSAGEVATVQEIQVANPDSRLINLSTRGQVKSGAAKLIMGFVVEGLFPKNLLLRGIGPGLVPLGIAAPASNPRLDPARIIGGTATPLAGNDDWDAALAGTFGRLGAFELAARSRDAALLVAYAPGVYTIDLNGATGDTGLGLIEAYDADDLPGAAASPRLVNLSTRGEVAAGDAALFGGFVISGTQPKRVLVRGVGPGLTVLNVPGVLADPVLTLFAGTQPVAANDDWQIGRNAAALADAAAQTGAFALGAGSRDAALLVTLAPGAYTVRVAGLADSTGQALVEIYEAN
jgi:hypothetical protein